MDKFRPQFPNFSSAKEFEEAQELSKYSKKHEKKWLEEYVILIRNGKYWDVDFLDYKCHKVFVSKYADDINYYRDDFINSGGTISFEDASWGLYYIATGQEYKLENEFQDGYAKA